MGCFQPLKTQRWERSKGNSQGESRAAPQKNSRWKVKGWVHKDKSTLQVGTGSRLRPSSLEAETRKQALSGNQQNCSWVIPAPKTAGGSSWGSVFKCMVFIGGGGGSYASGFPVSWSEPASTSSPNILPTDIWLLQWVINRNEKQKQNLLWTFVEFPFCSVVKVWIYQMTKCLSDGTGQVQVGRAVGAEQPCMGEFALRKSPSHKPTLRGAVFWRILTMNRKAGAQFPFLARSAELKGKLRLGSGYSYI